ncbi:S9 family peptidase [Actinomadura verrucosospora]|uniref:Acyl-peptide hydrolase n=1 Tax=Actinomadura verrucosospora TaxID=46165 RepID=A0A7D3ZJI8_ACTVE|nr:prolyl oligopeptidase family serine peptidase [Actinomadura verrucosospora]QKG19883.1 acyl-peptide hydrolase [Actinomadura verrucosospora]
MSETRAYGSWPSPLSAAEAADSGEARRLMEQWVTVHGSDVWWTEYRAAEGGRATLVRWTPGDDPRDVLAGSGTEWNVRNRLHEYGGRPFAVLPDGERFVFTHWGDQRLWLGGGGTAVPLTPPGPGLHYADPVAVGGEVWCVREEVTGPASTDRRRALVAVPLSGEGARDPGLIRVLAASHRFVTGPKVSPDGRHAAWIGWDHPAMPWDGSELCVAEIAGGRFGAHRVLAGGPAEAVCQAWWRGPDALVVLSDPDGWWNPRLAALDGSVRALWSGEREVGGPLWRVGSSWSAPLADGRIALLVTGWYERDGEWSHGTRLALLDPGDEKLAYVDGPETVWSNLASSGTVVAAMGAGPDHAPAVLRLDAATGAVDRPARRPGPRIAAPWRPRPVHRAFPSGDGAGGVHAIVFGPRNPGAEAPAGTRPPLLVTVHGGPTGCGNDALDPTVAFFTSRGFAVAVVNYGGSTGHGRAYRERLRGGWGVVDVADCAAVALALADEGVVDRDGLVIRGGSAGGWTTCVSLTGGDGGGVYRCGTAYYPVVDLLGWAGGETHDLETRYLDGLVGPLPEATGTYRARSPVHRVDAGTRPMLLLQGEEDPMCPPVQCERLVAALAGQGVPHRYLTFPGEQHGFRRADSIRRALEAELSFYRRTLGLAPSEEPEKEGRWTH